MCGRWYLPMFLFRDGSLTLMNRASLIALVRFWSSLPIMVRLLRSTLWPEMLQWSWMGEGDFWCSLNLSAKFLADSPIYSSSHPSSLHLNLYMAPLLLVIGSLSLGAMSRSFMVWPPLKCTCTPYFDQCFWTSQLALVDMVPPCICFCWLISFGQFDCYCFCLVFLLEFWLFILALSMAQMGYMHSSRAWHRWSSSFCSCGSEHIVLALWYRVPATLYLVDMVWCLFYCRYKSVWVGFLNTDVLRLPSSLGVTKMSRNGIDPSSLTSSQVNFMAIRQ